MPTRLRIIDGNYTTGPTVYAAPPSRAPEPSTSQPMVVQQGGNYVSTAVPVAAPAPAPASNSNAILWIGAGVLVLLFMGKKR